MNEINKESNFMYIWKIQGDDFSDIVEDTKYTCLCCGEKYNRPRNFIEHIRGAERKTKRADTVLVFWNCQWCEAIFKSLSGLAKHYEEGCKKLCEEMYNLKEEKTRWDGSDEALKEMGGDGEVVVLDYKELTAVDFEGDADDEDEGEGPNVEDKDGEGDDENEESDEDENGNGGRKRNGVLEETGDSEPSSGESEDDYTGNQPTGLENMISSLGILREETSDDDDEEWAD
ncbi:hypothetical protein TWF718_005655 [Orbilia javanica]|uniref:Uncharacterized protein n=1 Tax=Orbilia javanica TaxID=47235 RepID=A0AAN8REC7_9PEZI